MNDTAAIYLDHAATTPMAPEAIEAMRPFLREDFGNPSSIHSAGGRAARALEAARERTAALAGARSPEEIAFTSGGTESDAWAIVGRILAGEARHIVTSAVEHHAVLETVEAARRIYGCEATVLPVDAQGLVDPDSLRRAIRDDTAVVSIMHANNETGTVQPIRELVRIAHERGAVFHTDAVQAAGKIPIDVEESGVDLLSLSAHKFYGPKGIGALYIRRGTRLEPLQRGGGQEGGRRAGTVNVPGAVGMGAAASLALEREAVDTPRERALVELLWARLSSGIPRVRRNGHPFLRLPGILNVSVEGVDGEALLMALDRLGILVSTGSACAAGSMLPSHVLRAMGTPQGYIRGSLRFSLGRGSGGEDILRVAEHLPGIVERLRAIAPGEAAQPGAIP